MYISYILNLILIVIMFLILGFLVALLISLGLEKVELIHKKKVEIYLSSSVDKLNIVKIVEKGGRVRYEGILSR